MKSYPPNPFFLAAAVAPLVPEILSPAKFKLDVFAEAAEEFAVESVTNCDFMNAFGVNYAHFWT